MSQLALGLFLPRCWGYHDEMFDEARKSVKHEVPDLYLLRLSERSSHLTINFHPLGTWQIKSLHSKRSRSVAILIKHPRGVSPCREMCLMIKWKLHNSWTHLCLPTHLWPIKQQSAAAMANSWKPAATTSRRVDGPLTASPWTTSSELPSAPAFAWEDFKQRRCVPPRHSNSARSTRGTCSSPNSTSCV